MSTKYIFITGGVTSSLGKGIICASLGRLLVARGLKVTIQKLDPYIKLDGKRSKKNQTRKPNRINIEFLDSVKQVRKFQVQCLEDSSVDVTVPYIPNQNDEFTMVTQVIY